ncbi:MAG: c-type cytochrome [Gammaproteobacteria bacterium]
MLSRVKRIAFSGLSLAIAQASLAGGDPEQGQRLYQNRCGACHSLDANRVGPRHRGIFGRRAGVVPEYVYSRALRDSSVVWSEDTLERWLENPEALVPGQRMYFRVTAAADRASIIAYLKLESAP